MKSRCCVSTCSAIILLVLLNGWFQCVGGCFEDERRALLLIIRDSVPYYKDRYLPTSTWKGEDCCQWHGIDCSNSTRQVVAIDLGEMFLSKFVNYTLFAAFKELRDLRLNRVRMTGGDQILNVTCKLKHLRSLEVYNFSINNSIPTCLCDNGLLTTLVLLNSQLKGSIPSSLCNMKSLLSLDLSDNQLEGNIPSCLCNMKSLQSLDLSDNQLDGNIPSCLCNIKSLQSLDLSDNQLDGKILSCLCNMKSLQSLDLSDNQLDGKIPSCLGNMKSLEHLDLSSNQLTGNIPHSIFPNLTMMAYIDISNNQFSGVFSFSILANLSKLEQVDLSNNVQLEVDTESPTWVPSFQLFTLRLANCNLNKQTGSIPSFISSQHGLFFEYLDLSYNSLEGKIPYWLLYNTSSKLLIRGNKLVGPLPSPPTKNMIARVQWLDMSDNRISGPLSANSDFFLSSSLQFLNMSSNGLDGEIPESMGFMKNHLRGLDLSNNNLSGEMPYWLAANNSKVRFLKLSNNKFQGKVLQENSNMTELLALYLDGNNFTGSIPASLVNSPNLMILDIGDNNMSGDLYDLFPMPSRLRALIFRRNNLQGHIPRHLCLLQQLQYLDLSGNLFSGDIPSCFANITSMTKENHEPLQGYLNEDVLFISDYIPIFVAIDIRIEIRFITKRASYIFKGKPVVVMNGIDFSFNQLTGSIPAEIGYLKGLHSLNLSHNSLIGPIPLSFRYMKSLESLDLSYNHINGTIPLEMVGLDSLAVLNVSFNNLSGEIPSYGHFLTLNDPTSFMGNPGLCGRELERHCSSDNAKPPISLDNDACDENSSIMDSSLAFYSSVAISYILGFWGVIALLIFKKNWRYKFFKFADVLLEGCYEKLWALHFYLKNRFKSC